MQRANMQAGRQQSTQQQCRGLNNNRDITAAVGLQNETVCVGEKSPQASVEVFQLYSKYLQDILKVVGTRYPKRTPQPLKFVFCF